MLSRPQTSHLYGPSLENTLGMFLVLSEENGYFPTNPSFQTSAVFVEAEVCMFSTGHPVGLWGPSLCPWLGPPSCLLCPCGRGWIEHLQTHTWINFDAEKPGNPVQPAGFIPHSEIPG